MLIVRPSRVTYRPPLGFLRTMKAFPGARITLTFNVAPEYGSRVLTDIDNTGTLTVQGKDVAAPTAATDHKVKAYIDEILRCDDDPAQ